MIKPIKFIYYQMFKSNLSDDDKYSLVPLISAIDSLPLKERIREIDDDKYRLEDIYLDDYMGINCYHLRFMRLDEANIPNMSYDDRESAPLKLNDGEYLGTPLHILYDIDNEIFMIQQSRTTMSVGKLNRYLSQMAISLNLFDGGSFIEFRPIISISKIGHGAIYKKIVLKFANIERANIEDNTDLKRIIDLYNDYEAVTGEVIISLGRFRTKQLADKKVRGLCNEIGQNKDYFKSATVSYSTIDGSGVIDLIEDVIKDEISFDIEKRTSLSFIQARDEMLRRYIVRRDRILFELGG